MLKLERAISLLLLLLFMVYGYTAWFVMDALLPPILKFNPVWPSSFPKIISVLGIITSLAILLTAKGEKSENQELDLDSWKKYDLKTTISLIAMMTFYALALKAFGFLLATFIFLFLSSYLLGERKLVFLSIVCIIASFSIWGLVDYVLGIYLQPLPEFLKG